ncbi:MAG: PASTA domain-containing protein, partial [Clostridia bacterium]
WTVIIITISRQSDEATVPNMFGDTLEAATQKLIDAGLVLGTVYQDTTSILPIGTVVLQSVLANQKVATNTAIDITISGRTAEYADKVPNVLGKDMYTAELLLKNAKYTVKFKYTVSDQPIDTVLSQSLQADTSGHLKGTEIVLEIAESQTTRTNVPDLFGLTRAEAEAKLAENHLFLGDITYNEQSVFTPGTVFEQSLSSGTEVEKRTYINVSISGAEPKIPN